MMRALFSGISGLKSLQSNMDVIGNNISNVNTTGYKSGRMTFQESMNQTISGASSPGGLGYGTGGINPLQIGLGSGIASVDTQFAQGNMQSTGQTTDLAIQGNAFFVVSKGDENFYTRDGAFSLDSLGHLVMPGNGMILQGYNSDDDGNIPVTAIQQDISIPFNTSAPARATTTVNFARNLDADSAAEGTITYTSRFLAPSNGTVLASAASGPDGRLLGIQAGDTLTFSAFNPTTSTNVAGSFPVTATTTMNDIAAAMQAFVRGPAGSAGTTLAFNALTGELQMNAAGGDVEGFNVISSRPVSSSKISSAFFFPSSVASGTSTSTAKFLRPASDTDLLANTFDTNGNPMGRDPATGIDVGLQDGDVISFSGAVGGEATTKGSITYDHLTTSMADVMRAIRDQFRLPQTDGSVLSNPTVSLNGAGTQDDIPDGSLVIRGLPEKAYSLTDLSVHSNDVDNISPTPSNFNTNMGFKELQTARDTTEVNTSIPTYDDKGFQHNLSVVFTKSAVPNEWFWTAHSAGTEQIQAGGSGKVAFGADGTVSNFTFDDNASNLVIDPQNGAAVMHINLDPGGPGKFAGLTQFQASSTAAAVNQDGHTMGSLRNISIGADGIITGQFSNGVTRSLAQVVVADFTNSRGLMHESDSVYSQSPNSGDPVYGRPGTQSTSTLQSGSLEMSNVDLASQFTDMITTQRGYQANARIITTSDSMLQELVGLIR